MSELKVVDLKLDDLSNDELMEYVIEKSGDQKAALLLKQRWMDFWAHVRDRFKNHPYVEPDWLLEYDHKIKGKLREINTRENEIHRLEAKIDATKGFLSELNKHDYMRLKRKVWAANSAVKHAQQKSNDLRRQLKRTGQIILYYQRNKIDALRGEKLVMKVQKEMIKDNLVRINRHLHRLALVEAGLLDAALTIPGKNNGTPVES